MELKKENPIGFMDSGLGGISVLKEAVRLMPDENFIYYGDSANAPYGTKDVEVIRKLTFDVVEKLLKQNIKGLAVACNTATSAAVKQLRISYPELPIVGIEPALKPAVTANHGGRIIVLATPMTIQQEKFHNLLDKYKGQAEIIPVGCKGLMEFVEEGKLDGDVLDAYFKEHIEPYVTENTEAMVLGCTHYPFLRPHLRDYFLGKDIRIIDGSEGTSRELKRRLAEKNLLRESVDRSNDIMPNPAEHILFENSSPDHDMIERCWKLFYMDIN